MVESASVLDVTVTNSGPATYSYDITVAALSPDRGTRYETNRVFLEGLAPGQNAAPEAIFYTQVPADAVFAIVDYSRWPSWFASQVEG